MITHVVMMKFKPEVTDADVDELEKMLDDLPNKIIEIQSYDFGRDVVHGERSFDFALVSVFANLETLRQYQTHQAHLKVVQRLRQMCEQIIAVDYRNTPLKEMDDASESTDENPWARPDLFRPI